MQIKKEENRIIKRGKSRIVWMFSEVGIVIKFPIIPINCVFINFFLDFYTSRDFVKNNLFNRFMFCMNGLVESFRREVFIGIVNNWREFYFYFKTRHSFLQPTYFSFFGLFNVQRMGSSYNITEKNLKYQLSQLTGQLWKKDGHHFSNPRNFCLGNKKLRIVDYGSPNTQNVILECGMKIFNEFDPNWKEESTHRT